MLVSWRKRIWLLAGLPALLMAGASFAEEANHNSNLGVRSRPLANPSSSVRLNELVSSCLAGRPLNSGVGGVAVNPGIPGGDGGLTGAILPPEQPIVDNADNGGSAIDEGNTGQPVSGAAVFQAKCASCHQQGDPRLANQANLTRVVNTGARITGNEPAAMMANISSLSTDEKTALLEFLTR